MGHGIGFGPNKVNFQNTEKLTQLVTLIIKMSKDFGNIGDIFMFLWQTFLYLLKRPISSVIEKNDKAEGVKCKIINKIPKYKPQPLLLTKENEILVRYHPFINQEMSFILSLIFYPTI